MNVSSRTRWIKRRLGEFVTNDKIIQAFLTGSAFAVLGTGAGVIGHHVSAVTPFAMVEVKWLVIIGIAAFWYWVEHNQQEFEEKVQAWQAGKE